MWGDSGVGGGSSHKAGAWEKRPSRCREAAPRTASRPIAPDKACPPARDPGTVRFRAENRERAPGRGVGARTPAPPAGCDRSSASVRGEGDVGWE